MGHEVVPEVVEPPALEPSAPAHAFERREKRVLAPRLCRSLKDRGSWLLLRARFKRHTKLPGGQIARKLGCTVKNIEYHVSNVLRRTGMQTR